jgi:hypothetical protein
VTLAHDPCRHASDDLARSNLFGHDRSSADHGAFTDGAIEDHRAGTDQDVAPKRVPGCR